MIAPHVAVALIQTSTAIAVSGAFALWCNACCTEQQQQQQLQQQQLSNDQDASDGERRERSITAISIDFLLDDESICDLSPIIEEDSVCLTDTDDSDLGYDEEVALFTAFDPSFDPILGATRSPQRPSTLTETPEHIAPIHVSSIDESLGSLRSSYFNTGVQPPSETLDEVNVRLSIDHKVALLSDTHVRIVSAHALAFIRMWSKLSAYERVRSNLFFKK